MEVEKFTPALETPTTWVKHVIESMNQNCVIIFIILINSDIRSINVMVALQGPERYSVHGIRA